MANAIQNGTCVFFKEFQTTAHPRKHSKFRMKNLAFGVLLGDVPVFGKGPTTGDLFRSLGAIGYISFDDVGEFLGAEMGAKCVEEFEKKYTIPPKNLPVADDGTPLVEPSAPPLPQEKVAEILDEVAAEPEQSNIVDINGKPIV